MCHFVSFEAQLLQQKRCVASWKKLKVNVVNMTLLKRTGKGLGKMCHDQPCPSQRANELVIVVEVKNCGQARLNHSKKSSPAQNVD